MNDPLLDMICPAPEPAPPPEPLLRRSTLGARGAGADDNDHGTMRYSNKTDLERRDPMAATVFKTMGRS